MHIPISFSCYTGAPIIAQYTFFSISFYATGVSWITLSLGDLAVKLFVSLVIHLIGVTVIRWLFFAEAEHVVGIYYSKR